MTYRRHSAHALSGRVVHGKYPSKVLPLVGMLFCFAVAFPFGVWTFGSQTLSCPASGQCVVRNHWTVLSSYPPFERSSITSVRVLRGGRADEGVVGVMSDERRLYGSQLMDADRAQRLVDEINEPLGSGKAFEVVTDRGYLFGIVALLWLLIGSAPGYFFFKDLVVGRLIIDVVKDGAALRVKRTLLGIPFAGHEMALDGVVDVTTERGRIVLVGRDGKRANLTKFTLPDDPVYVRTAAALREILGFRQDSDIPPST